MFHKLAFRIYDRRFNRNRNRVEGYLARMRKCIEKEDHDGFNRLNNRCQKIFKRQRWLLDHMFIKPEFRR